MQLFVPFTSTWRPHAVAWGIFATYLLLAIQITSWAMRRLPRKLWHRVHVLSLPMLVIATVHGFLAGTDRSNQAVQLGAFALLLGRRVPRRDARALALGSRARRRRRRSREQRPGAAEVDAEEVAV